MSMFSTVERNSQTNQVACSIKAAFICKHGVRFRSRYEFSYVTMRSTQKREREQSVRD